jgi:nondiscriminating glutamyl-tRNA synthetase
MNNSPRVRIAPSPTGMVHLGTLRTILYNYLFAKHNNGKFIIRIEDTDRTRLVPGALENLLEALEWAEIETDEGPYLTTDRKVKQKGEFGPYIQSERLEIYKQHLDDLIDKGKAYYCFCNKERINKLREQQVKDKKPPKYDGLCRNLTKDEIKSMIDSGAPYVIRFKMPENKDVIVNDLVRGEIIVNTKDLDDYVLIKSDGYPTYHFASIVDDHLMKITTVMRGDEWIASTPKHVLLYEAFGWNAPEFAHLPSILNKNGKKMSKRDGDSSVSDFVNKGYLKDALLNFIAMLGWNAGIDQEIYTMRELEKQFSIDNIHKGGAIFDTDKLDWINGQYIRELSIDEFYTHCLPYLEKENILKKKDEDLLIVKTNETVKPSYVKNILELEKSRIKKFSEIGEAISFFFDENLEYDLKKIIWKKSTKEDTIENLKKLEKLLKDIKEEQFTEEKLESSIKQLMEQNSIDTGSLLWPMRFALSGRDKSPGPFEIATALGKEKTVQRIGHAIAKMI